MASTVVPGPDPSPPRPQRRSTAPVAALLLVCTAARRGAVRVARLLAWFAADPQRARAAGAALLACIAVGAVVGVGMGLLLDGLAELLLALVTGP